MFAGSSKVHGYLCRWTKEDPHLAYTTTVKVRLSRDQ
jgi:hypothetical protein